MLLVGDRLPGPCCDGTVLFMDDDGTTFVHYENGDEALLLPRDGEWDAFYFPYDRFVRPERTSHLKPGARLMASWEDDWFYPGTVLFVNPRSGRVVVRFDDGACTIAKADQLKPMQLPADGQVSCRLQDGDVFFATKISKKQGDHIFVEYHNPRLGSEWTTMAQIRLPASAFTKPQISLHDVFSVN